MLQTKLLSILSKFNLILSSVSKVLPTYILKKYARWPISVFYHNVSSKRLPYIEHLHYIPDKKRFEDDINYLMSNFRPISLSEIAENITNARPIPENTFFISFDDGLRGSLELAAPILKKRAIPFAMFVNPNFVGNRNLSYKYKQSLLINNYEITKESYIKELFHSYKLNYTDFKSSVLSISYKDSRLLDEIADLLNHSFSDYLKKEKPYLDETELRHLIDYGCEIGAHSMNHPNYYELSFDEQKTETIDGIKWVEEKFNPPVKTFAFPFSDNGISRKFFKELFEKEKIDLCFGTSGNKIDILPNIIQRIWLEENSTAQNIINRELTKSMIRVFIGNNRINR